MRNAIRTIGAIALIMFFVPTLHASDSVKVAAIFSLTGPYAEISQSSVLGTKLGVEEINARGGLLGKKIDLMVLDNQSTPIGSSVAAEKAEASGAVAILGSVLTSHSLPIARVAQETGVPMISNYSTGPDLTKIGNCIFRVCFDDNFQGLVMARFAWSDLHARTATVFTNLNSEYSIELTKIFRKYFTEMGGRIAAQIEYKPNQSRYVEQITQAMANPADVVFLTGHDESGVLALQLQQAGSHAIFLGGDGWAEGSFLEMGGRAISLGYYCSHWSEASSSARSRAFVAKYGSTPHFGTGTALAYDAVMLLEAAANKAGSLDRKKLRDALADTLSFEGVTGVIRFHSDGNLVKSAVIMELSEGVPRFLKTFEP